MKKLYYLFGIGLLALGLYGCGGDDEGQSGSLSVKDKLVEVGPDMEEVYVDMHAKGGRVSLHSSEAWCTPAMVDGKLRLIAAANGDAADRKAVVTVSVNELAEDIEVKQDGLQVEIENYVSELKVTQNGKDVKMTIATNSKLLNIYTADKWLDCTVDDNAVSLSIKPSATERQGELRINIGARSYDVIVKQINVTPYGNYLGDFTLYYLNDWIENTSMNVTLSAKENGKSYTLSGDKLTYDLEVMYGEFGELFFFPQKLDEETITDHFFLDDGDYDVWFALWGSMVSMTSPTISPNASLIARYGVMNGEDRVLFYDGGGWSLGELDCFCISYYTKDGIYSFDKYSDDFEGTYMDLSMAKK